MNKNFLYDYQIDAVNKMHNGCILNGGVGSGKSRTGLYYYFKEQGGSMIPKYKAMKVKPRPKDLYIITTARKRDTKEWEGELSKYLLSTDEKQYKRYGNHIYVDSWNNIKKYADIKDAFFIFDEQRACGSGIWAKTFIKIAKHNNWIMLSATPGDNWMDYLPVFIANGFYKNKTDFVRQHVIYSRFTKYPKIDRYIGTGKLLKLRNEILIDMDFKRQTVSHHENIYVNYDKTLYRDVTRTRWNPYTNEPIEQISSLCYILRRVVNDSDYRFVSLLELLENIPRAIIFYNFDYELEKLRTINLGDGRTIAEWNGHKHEPIPKTKKWVYLVQYSAGAEGWNCVDTNTIIFYSQNYSYKTMEQASGRIDRLNTPFKDLYYYHLKSRSGIDLAISKTLNEKKDFNETRWFNKYY